MGIVKKRLAVNNPRDIRTRYVVDGVYIIPTKKQAQNFQKLKVKKKRRKK